MKCTDCVHFEVCCYVDPSLPVCGSFIHKNCAITLPCQIGTNLYRIDSRNKPCSFRNHHKDEWYCLNIFNCNEECDSREEYYIYEIKNADAITILGNAKYFDTRVFTSKEEAEKKLEELNEIHN